MPSDQVRASHLLIKHTGSRNPISRRTGQRITLSPEDATAELNQYEATIRREAASDGNLGKIFAQYASQRSDCSSYERNGDLGFFGPGMMQRPFEEATYALSVGEMSGIVSTDSGYHLIYRIE